MGACDGPAGWPAACGRVCESRGGTRVPSVQRAGVVHVPVGTNGAQRNLASLAVRG